MKKINFGLWLMLSAVMSLSAQTFKERVNVSLFSGWEQNNISDSRYYGLYSSWFAYKGDRWMIGPYVVGALSGNDSRTGYNGNAWEVGLGLSSGWYFHHFFNDKGYATWIGISGGLKYAADKGELSQISGSYRGNQKDWLGCFGADFSLWKKNALAWWPRVHAQFTVQSPLSEKKEAYWNNLPIADPAWDKGYLASLLKVSLLNIAWGQTYASPKIIAAHSFSQGDKQSNLGLGAELSLHKPFRDDFFSVYALYKISNTKSNRLALGISFNLMSL